MDTKCFVRTNMSQSADPDTPPPSESVCLLLPSKDLSSTKWSRLYALPTVHLLITMLLLLLLLMRMLMRVPSRVQLVRLSARPGWAKPRLLPPSS